MQVKSKVKIVESGLVIEGPLRNFQGGVGGDLILEFITGTRMEFHGVSENLIAQMNKFGLQIVMNSTIDLDRGTMTVDRRDKK